MVEIDPSNKESWQYDDEYEFWYMPFPGTNQAQAEEGVRWRGFKPWEHAQLQKQQSPNLQSTNLQSPKREDGWQDISTAPFGEDILVYEKAKDDKDRIAVGIMNNHETFTSFSVSCVSGYDYDQDLDKPTHWQPLPAAPKRNDMEGGE